jgi:antitoxin (DNA-binding transcriptional repressor) of toxin-antitoxin stability system
MRTISAEEASGSFLEWLDRVEASEEIVITRGGRPVATLRPYGEVAMKDAGSLEVTPERKAAIEHAIRLVENAPKIGKARHDIRDEMHEP